MDRPGLLLKSHYYFRGLPDEILDDVAQHIRISKFDTGDIVVDGETIWDDIFFIVEGRVKVVVIDSQGRESLFGFAERGDQLGMITSALKEPTPTRAIAVEPTTLMLLNEEEAFQLSARHTELRRHWRQCLAGAMAKQFLKQDRSAKALIVAAFHSSTQTRHLTNELINRLRPSINGKVGLISDFDGATIPDDAIAHRIDKDERVELESLFQKFSEWREMEVVFIDLDSKVDVEVITRICSLSEKVIWWLDLGNQQVAIDRIATLDPQRKGFSDKMVAAWWLGEETVSPIVEDLKDRVVKQFKISSKTITESDNLTPRVNEGIQRLANYLRGIQIGLALGGGAARGMAHLGVLKALEDAGIVIDRIAGTSAGAMVGSLYAWGLSADFMTKQFAIDLKPPRLFRMMPKGLYWYLLYKYRTGRFGPMLRKYIGTAALEQLQIPSSTIAVDLVRGEPVVRRRGEAVNSILESINLPVLSVPMMQQDSALIDGGFINNVPADVLVEQGCNIVIAVDVLSKMEQEFLKIRPGGEPSKKVYPNFLQTYMRIYAIQNSKLTTAGTQAADVTIQPDLTDFSLAAFTQAEEMAKIGRAAAEEQIPKIKHLIDSLERRIRRSISAKINAAGSSIEGSESTDA